MKHKIQTEYVEVSKLIPYALNARTHDEVQVAQIAASIREFGFTNPVLIDENDGIIAGHGRVLAAKKIKLETVPCIRLGGYTETQKKAYIIADNQLALNSGWNYDMLAVEIDSLNDAKYDISMLGFSNQELGELIGSPEIPEENEEEKKKKDSETTICPKCHHEFVL
jgi:ParB-like chromosome segregation protein Spo0J